jgi:hypothetical protein
MTPLLQRLLRRPLAWTVLIALGAGCASPLPGRVTAPERAGAGPIPLRIHPVVQGGGYRLRAFTGWQAQDVATVTARLYDLSGTTPLEVASAALDTSQDRLFSPGNASHSGGFDLGGLQHGREYRVELRAYRTDGNASQAIGVDADSSATFDTYDVNGEYPTAKDVKLPLVLMARPFPGLLDVVVDGVAAQDFMVVTLSPLEGAQGQPVATTVALSGAGSATLAFGDLEPNATYVVERLPYTGTLNASTPLTADIASKAVSTSAAAATTAGRVATATVRSEGCAGGVTAGAAGAQTSFSQFTTPVLLVTDNGITSYFYLIERNLVADTGGINLLPGQTCVTFGGESRLLDAYLYEPQ